MIRKILLLTILFSLLYIFFKFLNIYLDLSIISKIIGVIFKYGVLVLASILLLALVIYLVAAGLVIIFLIFYNFIFISYIKFFYYYYQFYKNGISHEIFTNIVLKFYKLKNLKLYIFLPEYFFENEKRPIDHKFNGTPYEYDSSLWGSYTYFLSKIHNKNLSFLEIKDYIDNHSYWFLFINRFNIITNVLLDDDSIIEFFFNRDIPIHEKLAFIVLQILTFSYYSLKIIIDSFVFFILWLLIKILIYVEMISKKINIYIK